MEFYLVYETIFSLFYITICYKKNLNMDFENTYTIDKKKKDGVFYTPPDMADFMSSKSLCFDRGGIWFDPCCGLGILSIKLAQMQDDPVGFVSNRLVINDKDSDQLARAVSNFVEIFGVSPRVMNVDFLEADIECDYIIMNPPYFKYGESDIYAYFIEKACRISKGFISINPISFTNGSKFRGTRSSILGFSSILMYHFDNIPGHIFDDAQVRVSVIVAHNESDERKTTTQIRWQTKMRNQMIASLDSRLDDGLFTEDIFYKTSPNTLHMVHGEQLKEYTVLDSEYCIYVVSTPRYFITASSSELDRTGQIRICMKDRVSWERAMIMLNSSYLYWWWRTSDSSMSLTKTTLLSLPWVCFEYDSSVINDILESECCNKVYKMNAGKRQENVKHPRDLVMRLNSIFTDERLIDLQD